MNTTTEYEQEDQRGRDRFLSWASLNDEVTMNKIATDPLSIWDISYYSGGTAIIGEIKNRRCKSTTYDSSMLELNKLRDLQEVRDKVLAKEGVDNVIIHYICLYEDNKIMVWDITDEPHNHLLQELPRNFCGDKKNKEKKIIYLQNNKKIKL